MITGFVPSYELDSDIGKKIAQLKGLERGWHYPTFLLYYIRNPGPLLLFDEIVVDKEAARKAVEYISRYKIKHKDYERSVVNAIRPTQSEIQTFKRLIDSKLFRKQKVVKMITSKDFERIKQGYFKDIGMSGLTPNGFRNSVAVLKNRYGQYYASPDPERFEAMNINVTWVVLEKLSAVPLDDILRSPLYEYKAIQTASFGMEMVKTAYDMIHQARQVLYLPSKPLHDIDAFLSLHKDLRVRHFRETVRDLSKRKATPEEISQKIYEANIELQKLEIDRYNVVITLLGMIADLISMQQGNFATGLFGTATGLISIGKEIKKVMKMERYGWLKTVKGLCEI